MAMLDHLIVPSHDRKASAKLLADLLNVKSGDSFGVFSAVYVNDSLTIDFMQGDEFETTSAGICTGSILTVTTGRS